MVFIVVLSDTGIFVQFSFYYLNLSLFFDGINFLGEEIKTNCRLGMIFFKEGIE